MSMVFKERLPLETEVGIKWTERFKYFRNFPIFSQLVKQITAKTKTLRRQIWQFVLRMEMSTSV